LPDARLLGEPAAALRIAVSVTRFGAPIVMRAAITALVACASAYDFGTCAESGQCAALGRMAALEMAPYDVGVTDCRRVDSDAGIGAPSERITLEITYREYIFCGA
jgi:hypothetical protein